MSPKEGVYYAAWMTGIITSVMLGRVLGWPHLVSLGIGIVGGLGLGMFAEKAYVNKFGDTRSKRPPSDDIEPTSDHQVLAPGEVACRDPNCRWVGESRYHVTCPKCGSQLH